MRKPSESESSSAAKSAREPYETRDARVGLRAAFVCGLSLAVAACSTSAPPPPRDPTLLLDASTESFDADLVDAERVDPDADAPPDPSP